MGTLKELHEQYILNLFNDISNAHLEEQIFFDVANRALSTSTKEFQQYFMNLVSNIRNNYVKIFQDPPYTALLPDEKDTQWNTLLTTLATLETSKSLSVVSMLLICMALLFMLRVTRRAMLITRVATESEETSQKVQTIRDSLHEVYSYVTAFILSVLKDQQTQQDEFNKLQKEKTRLDTELASLSKNILTCALDNKELSEKAAHKIQELTKKNEETLRLLKEQQTQQQIQKDEFNKLEKEKTQSDAELASLSKNILTCALNNKELSEKAANKIQELTKKNEETLRQLKEKTEELRKCTDPLFQQQAFESQLAIITEKKMRLGPIIALAKTFSMLFAKFIKKYADSNAQGVTESTYLSVLASQQSFKTPQTDTQKQISNALQSNIDKANQIVKDATPILETKHKVNQPLLAKYKPFIEYLLSIVQLEGPTMDSMLRTTEYDSVLEQLYPQGDTYNRILLLYEDMSGAVRVIVRMRHVEAANVSAGGSRKRYKYAQHGGAINMMNYNIQLNGDYNKVTFEGVSQINAKFYGDDKNKSTREFGPFYAVHSGADSEDTIVQHSLKLDSLQELLKMGGNVVFYTYGYSGSGKTYTLFGDKQSIDKGVIWYMLKELNEKYQFDIELENRFKCYGYLDQENNKCVFRDTVKALGPVKAKDTISAQVAQWNKIITSDLQLEKDDKSFIKKTSNNPESSRGFYILKFGLLWNGKQVGKIGVVDMAGNEDPFDIASSMCPSLDFDKMDELIRDPSNKMSFDTVYGKVKEELMNFLKIVITVSKIDRLQQGKMFPQNCKNVCEMLLNKYESKPSWAQMKILKYTSNTLRKILTTTLTKRENDYFDKSTYTYFFKLPKSNESFMTVHANNTSRILAHINITWEFLCELLLILKDDLLSSYKHAPVVPNQVTLSHLRELLIDAKNNEQAQQTLQVNLLQFVEGELRRLQPEPTAITIDFSKRDNADANWNVQPDWNEVQYLKFINDMPRFANNDWQRTYNKDRYFIPFSHNDKPEYASYNTIAQIIKEGYYINKANAELIHYFNMKRQYQKIHADSTNKQNKTYEFAPNFSFAKYEKFSSFFHPHTSTTFDTQLVQTIIDEFTADNSKDIMFSCIRDDKELGKALGAIDTLLLVQDLKST